MQLLLVQLTLGYIATSTAFTGNALAVVRPRFTSPTCRWNAPPKSETEKAESNEDDIMNTTSKVQEEEEVPAVGNLVADEEWEGLTLELTELVRKSLVEDMKAKARDFLGKDDYELGDISKEVDARVKDEVAKMRQKDEYEFGDFCLAMDDLAKSYTEELTGKPYQPGDLSTYLDASIRSQLGKKVSEFTGKEGYEFGDITREVFKRRKAWMKDYLGEEAAENYKFGDITKKALTQFTGKDDYEFGDATKKILGNLFGKDKKK